MGESLRVKIDEAYAKWQANKKETPHSEAECQQMLQNYAQTINPLLVVEIRSKGYADRGYTHEKIVVVRINDLTFFTMNVRFTNEGQGFFTTPDINECKRVMGEGITKTANKIISS